MLQWQRNNFTRIFVPTEKSHSWPFAIQHLKHSENIQREYELTAETARKLDLMRVYSNIWWFENLLCSWLASMANSLEINMRNTKWKRTLAISDRWKVDTDKDDARSRVTTKHGEQVTSTHSYITARHCQISKFDNNTINSLFFITT